jgi:hypothetical protein
MSIETEVSSVAKTAETVVADVAKAPAAVKTFWQKYGALITHTLVAVASAYVGHKL